MGLAAASGSGTSPRDVDVTPDIVFAAQDIDRLHEAARDLLNMAASIAGTAILREDFAGSMRLAARHGANSLIAAKARIDEADEHLRTAVSATDLTQGRAKAIDAKIADISRAISEEDNDASSLDIFKKVVGFTVAVGGVVAGVATGVGAVAALGAGFAALSQTAGSAKTMFDLVSDVKDRLDRKDMSGFKTSFNDLNNTGKSIFHLGKMIDELSNIGASHPSPRLRELALANREKALMLKEVALHRQMEKEAQLGRTASVAERDAVQANIMLSNDFANKLSNDVTVQSVPVLRTLLSFEVPIEDLFQENGSQIYEAKFDAATVILHGARILRRLREARGWSWTGEATAIRETARRLGLERVAATSTSSIRRSLARWESPGGTVPDERYQYVLAHLFADRGGQFDLGPASDFRRLMTALTALGAGAERIAELAEAVLARAEQRYGNPLVSLTSGAGGPLDLARLAEVEQSYWMLISRVGKVPFAQSQVALAPFIEVSRRVEAAEMAPSAARSLAAHCLSVAGRLAFELHDDAGARRYYTAALTQAEQLPDQWLTAAIYTSLGMVTMHRGDDTAQAEQIARRAVQAAVAGSSRSTRARALAVQAEVAARRQLERPAAATLELARDQLAVVPADDPGGTGFDQARFGGFAGLCSLLVGRSQEAVTELEQAAAGVSASSDAVQRSIILADLAHAQLRSTQPRPEAAVAQLHECAELAGRTRGRVPMGRIRQVRRALRPWDGESFIGELDDHLYNALLR